MRPLHVLLAFLALGASLKQQVLSGVNNLTLNNLELSSENEEEFRENALKVTIGSRSSAPQISGDDKKQKQDEKTKTNQEITADDSLAAEFEMLLNGNDTGQVDFPDEDSKDHEVPHLPIRLRASNDAKNEVAETDSLVEIIEGFSAKNFPMIRSKSEDLKDVNVPWNHEKSKHRFEGQESSSHPEDTDDVRSKLMNGDYNWLGSARPPTTASASGHGGDHGEGHERIQLVEWRWKEVGIFFTFASFAVVAGLIRAAFHRSHFLMNHVPESCLMIGMGAMVGGVLYGFGVEAPPDETMNTNIPHHQGGRRGGGVIPSSTVLGMPVLTPWLFFNVLLPPVILQASYTLYDRAFLMNVYPILLHGTLGKFITTILIGSFLLLADRYGVMGSLKNYGGLVTTNYTLTVQDALFYASVTSGVDSGPEMPIFEENGLHKDLFFIILGESLLNDAVTVTLSEYTVQLAVTHALDHTEQYGKVTLYLIAVCLGGFMFGVVGGLASAIITRATQHCEAVEPQTLLGIAYVSYLGAELIRFSGHISIIVCGLVQAHYAFKNISYNSYSTVKDMTHLISSTSESVIYLFFGMVLVNSNHSWHSGFVAWTLVICFVSRLVVVVLLCGIHGAFGGRYMPFGDQFVLSYSGLRGAVCFCLSQMAEPTLVAPRQLFSTSIIALILFTTFIQGCSMKYVIELFNIKRFHWANGRTIATEVHEQFLDMTRSGVEEIVRAPKALPIAEKFQSWDERYFKKVFTRRGTGTERSRLCNEYLDLQNLAMLQNELVIAINGARHAKKNIVYVNFKPLIFSMVRKMGLQVAPTVIHAHDHEVSSRKNSRHVGGDPIKREMSALESRQFERRVASSAAKDKRDSSSSLVSALPGTADEEEISPADEHVSIAILAQQPAPPYTLFEQPPPLFRDVGAIEDRLRSSRLREELEADNERIKSQRNRRLRKNAAGGGGTGTEGDVAGGKNANNNTSLLRQAYSIGKSFILSKKWW